MKSKNSEEVKAVDVLKRFNEIISGSETKPSLTEKIILYFSENKTDDIHIAELANKIKATSPGVGKVVKLLVERDIMKLTLSAGKMNFYAWNHESEQAKVLLDIFCPVKCSEDYLKSLAQFYDAFLADELKIVGGCVRIVEEWKKHENEIKSLEKKQAEEINAYQEELNKNKQIIKNLSKEINNLKK